MLLATVALGACIQLSLPGGREQAALAPPALRASRHRFDLESCCRRGSEPDMLLQMRRTAIADRKNHGPSYARDSTRIGSWLLASVTRTGGRSGAPVPDMRSFPERRGKHVLRRMAMAKPFLVPCSPADRLAVFPTLRRPPRPSRARRAKPRIAATSACATPKLSLFALLRRTML